MRFSWNAFYIHGAGRSGIEVVLFVLLDLNKIGKG